MKRTDIEKVISEYKSESNPDDRYTSFDYSYNYFRETTDLNKDIEKSCLVLGYYLASWGMLRSSSFLSKKSIKHLQPTIEYISTLDKSVWNIDVDNYSEKNIKIIIDIYNEVKDRLIVNKAKDLTLVSKVLLGVFGFTPAFDSYFCDSLRKISNGDCGFRKLDNNSLWFIYDFYQQNKESIDNLASQTFTTDFISGKKTKTNYTKAKIIDMYGFYKGLPKNDEIVFQVLGEGGGISIRRKKNKSNVKYIYEHSEFDPTDEGLDVNIKDEYNSFEQAFQVINNKYPWYMLFIETVHDDFRNYIIERLIEKINEKFVSPDYLEHSKDRLEEKLNIKLIHKGSLHTNNLIWECERII